MPYMYVVQRGAPVDAMHALRNLLAKHLAG
jgi:hypothetical protein